MLALSVAFPRFSGSKFWVLRYGEAVLTDGLYTYPEPTTLQFPGRIEPIRDLTSVKNLFGEEIQGAIDVKTPPGYEVNIATKNVENDFIFYRKDFWKVEQSITYDSLIPHNEALATLVTNPGEDKKKFIPMFLGGVI